MYFIKIKRNPPTKLFRHVDLLALSNEIGVIPRLQHLAIFVSQFTCFKIFFSKGRQNVKNIRWIFQKEKELHMLLSNCPVSMHLPVKIELINHLMSSNYFEHFRPVSANYSESNFKPLDTICFLKYLSQER
jgi:hypothetical protein